jgi:hypothetical protein
MEKHLLPLNSKNENDVLKWIVEHTKILQSTPGLGQRLGICLLDPPRDPARVEFLRRVIKKAKNLNPPITVELEILKL